MSSCLKVLARDPLDANTICGWHGHAYGEEAGLRGLNTRPESIRRRLMARRGRCPGEGCG